MGNPRVINGWTVDELLDFHRAHFGDARMQDGSGGTPNPDGNQGGTTSTATDDFKPITAQADLDALIASRLERERAKYADYADVKAKASRLDEIEAANKSELEKATEQASTTAAERDDAKAEALRLRIAIEHSITVDDADLFLTGRDEETLRAQAKRLSDRETGRKNSNNHVSKEGTNNNASPNDERAFLRELFGSG